MGLFKKKIKKIQFQESFLDCSISSLNNSSDFRRESENYFKMKVFSDSRLKSSQKLTFKYFTPK